MKLRWKKEPAQTGLSAIGAAPRGYSYHDGVKQYAVVYPLGGDKTNPLRGWYFVAGWDSDIPVYNACDEPCETPGAAKKEAERYVKSFLG